MPLDITSFSTAKEKLSLFGATRAQVSSHGQPGEIREFTAIALTDGIPLSSDQFSQYVSGKKISTDSLSRFVLKAMIIGDANGNPLPPIRNPHSFLLDPCDLNDAPDVNTALRITKLYTTYITSADFDNAASRAIVKNDTIKVSMVVDESGHIVMERGEIVSLVSTPDPEEPPVKSCQSLSGVFDLGSPSLMGSIGSEDLTKNPSGDGWNSGTRVNMGDKQLTFMEAMAAIIVPSDVPLFVTSATRTAEDQARAMWNNKIKYSRTKEKARGIYSQDDLVDEIYDSSPSSQANWAKVIQGQIDRGRLISGHMRSDGLDINTKGLTSEQISAIKQAAESLGAKVVDETASANHWHIEDIPNVNYTAASVD